MSLANTGDLSSLRLALSAGALALVAACAAPGLAGDPCESEEDCEEELICHVEEGVCETEEQHAAEEGGDDTAE